MLRSTQGHITVLEALTALGAEVLKSAAEEEFLGRIAELLRLQVGCDAVLLGFLEPALATRVVASDAGVAPLAPRAFAEPLFEALLDEPRGW